MEVSAQVGSDTKVLQIHNRIQKGLLPEADLTLKKVIEITLLMELEAHQLGAAAKVCNVGVKLDRSKAKQCYRCGRSGHQLAGCWAQDLICHKCEKKRHVMQLNLQ